MHRAMPEATVLYFVTAVVVACLVVWVAVVLKTAKEPWAVAAASRTGANLAVGESDTVVTTERKDPDVTTKATPLALASEGNEETARDASATRASEAEKHEV